MLLTLHFCPSVATYRYPQFHTIRNRRCFSSLIQKPNYQIHNTGQREIMIATRDRQVIHYSTTSWQTASMLLPAGSCKKSQVNKTFRSNCGQNFMTFEMAIRSHSDSRISGWTGANNHLQLRRPRNNERDSEAEGQACRCLWPLLQWLRCTKRRRMPGLFIHATSSENCPVTQRSPMSSNY